VTTGLAGFVVVTCGFVVPGVLVTRGVVSGVFFPGVVVLIDGVDVMILEVLPQFGEFDPSVQQYLPLPPFSQQSGLSVTPFLQQ
jgi:hypothetical protein